MSHMKVLVIGDDVETQLAPYDENIKVEAYQDEDYSFADDVASARDFYLRHDENGVDPDKVSVRTLLDAYHGEGNGLRWNADESEATMWSTYNPKSKWDGYTVGGRYNATFKIKADAPADEYRPSERHWTEDYGNRADHTDASDHAMKRSIDFPAMVVAARADAEEAWDALVEAVGDIPAPAMGWDGYRAAHTDIIHARQAWNGHPWNLAARTLSAWNPYETFRMDAEDPHAAYVADREAMAVSGFYAVVRDGEWVARGEMGWFGGSEDSVALDAWRERVRAMIEALPEDTWLTVVDCHI